MLPPAPLLIIALAAPPAPAALPHVASADAVGWVHVPQLGAGLDRLERTPSLPLLWLFLPRDSRKAWTRIEEGELLMAAYRGAGKRPNLAAWLAVGRNDKSCQRILNRTLRILTNREPFSTLAVMPPSTAGATGKPVSTSVRRCGWSTEETLAAELERAAAKPLAQSAAFTRLSSQQAAADLRGHLDVQRLYGMWARSERGGRIAGLVTRLGLAGLVDIDATVRINDTRGVSIGAIASLPAPWTDLPGAFGPPIEPLRPAALPLEATAMARFSVHPVRLWYTLEKLFAYSSAIEYTLARAQLDAVERQLSKTWTDDALGDTARAWTFYRVPTARGGAAELLIAEVNDVAAAQILVESIAGLLPQIFPNLRVNSVLVRGSRLVSVAAGWRSIHIGFAKDHILLGGNREMVARHLGRNGKARPIAGLAEARVGYGFIERGAYAVELSETAELPRSVWTLAAEADRLRFDLHNGR